MVALVCLVFIGYDYANILSISFLIRLGFICRISGAPHTPPENKCRDPKDEHADSQIVPPMDIIRAFKSAIRWIIGVVVHFYGCFRRIPVVSVFNAAILAQSVPKIRSSFDIIRISDAVLVGNWFIIGQWEQNDTFCCGEIARAK